MSCVLQNKTLSDNTDEVLALQGVPWWKRKIIGAATVTLDVNHYKDEEGIENIDIKQTLTGGISGEFRHNLPRFVFTPPVYFRPPNIAWMDIPDSFSIYIGTTELRRLDGVEREHQDDIFGSVLGCSARTPVNELKEEWLKTGWSEDTLAHPLIYARGKSNTEKSGVTWTAHQVRTNICMTIGWLLIFLKDLGIPGH